MANVTGTGKYATMYTSKAYVFCINPETKTSWLGKVDRLIPVSFIASINDDEDSRSSSRRELKIIGTDDEGNTVLDSMISHQTTLAKRSPKFLQWTDPTETTHGLGFNSLEELTAFLETFQQLQRDILMPQSQQQTQAQPLNHGGSQSNSQSHMGSNQNERLASSWSQQQQQQQQQLMNNSVSETTNGRSYQPSRGPGTSSAGGSQAGGTIQAHNNMQQYSNTIAYPSHQQQQIKRQQPVQQNVTPSSNGNTSLNNGNAINNNNNAGYPRSQSMFGLQSKPGTSGSNSSNNLLSSGKVTPENENSQITQNEWQIRDQLKYENERLKQALEESSKNAGIWHSELLNLRTNNVKLTQALQESKAHVEEWERELFSLRDENKELKLRVSALESANPDKDLQKYKNYVEEVQKELRTKENEIDELQRAMDELQVKASSVDQNGHLDDSTSSHSVMSTHQKEKFNIMVAKLESKISELSGVQKELAQLMVDKAYH